MSANKKRGKQVGIVRLCIIGGKATPAPPIGPALGSHISNIAAFCKEFNSATADVTGMRVTIDVRVFADRSYELEVIGVPTSELIKHKLGIEKGSAKPNVDMVGMLSIDAIQELAAKKCELIGAGDLDAAVKCIAGTARSMGISVENKT